MSDYPFFFSYARNDDLLDAPDPNMQTFFAALSKRVRGLTGARQDGYRDRTDIKPGQDWRNELVDALVTAPTIVCMYSPSYFLSESCGKEMQVFLDRRREYMRTKASKRPGNIVPVLWEPCKIRACLPDFQAQLPLSLDHHNYGIREVVDRKSLDTVKELEFKTIVNNIALRIRDASNAFTLPPPPYQPVFGGVPSAFEPLLPPEDFDGPQGGAGPEWVTFVYPGEPDWQRWPYSPETDPVLHISTCAATRLEYRAQKIVFNVKQPDFPERLQQAIQKNTLVVLLVNGSTLSENNPQQLLLQQRLQEYDKQLAETSSAVIVWRSKDEFNDELVKGAFPKLSERRPKSFYPDIDSPEKLDKVIAGALDTLKMAVTRKPNNPKPLPAKSSFNSLPIMGSEN